MENKKEKLVETIKKYISHISEDKNTTIEIKEQLGMNHGIAGGDIEKILSKPECLLDVDVRELALITQQFFLKTGIKELDPDEWFTKYDMKEAGQYDKSIFIEENKTTEIVFENVNVVGNGVYSTVISPKRISELFKKQLLNYNVEIQRQPKFVKRNNEIRKIPTTYRKNVEEIKNLLLKGGLFTSTLKFNAALGSSDTEEEFTYDANKRTLTVNEGTILDILDGYHRCLGSDAAISVNNDLGDFNFILELSNYTTKQAQNCQAQLAKATPIPKARQDALAAERQADTVVQILRSESELKDRITEGGRVSHIAGELVTYNVMADAIEREFPMKTKMEARNVAKYLSEFFEYLIGSYPDEFLETDRIKTSLMSYNKIFAGYIALAAEMKKENISLDKLKNILDEVDFSRENNAWKEMGILDNEGKVRNGADERKFSKYFKGFVEKPFKNN
jgi:hypothetical protein